MKVEVKGKYAAVLVEYPKLKIDIKSGLIILFIAPEKGTCVRENSTYNIGFYASDWCMDCFEDFHGEITLKND